MNSIYQITDPYSIFLSLAVLIPLVLGIVLVFVPSFIKRNTIDFVGVLGCVIPAVFALFLAGNFRPLAAHGYAFLSSFPLGLEGIGANLSFGLNAFSLPMFVLTAIVGLAVAFYTLGSKVERRGLFWGMVLMILGGTLGAFATVDMFYSFLFHEMALLPTVLAVAIFGGSNRRSVSIEVGIWLLAGSLLMLVGMLLFYFWGGAGSFDIIDIRERLSTIAHSASLHPLIWAFLMTGLAIIVGLWPFYSWVPKLLATAPTAVSMLHVGALKMFGFYYLVQFFVGWTHVGVVDASTVGSILAVASIILLGISALNQTDLRNLLSYANLAHVGVLVIAIMAYTHESVVGLTLSMVGSGLTMSLLFMLAGTIDRRVGCLEMLHLSGLRQRTPRLSAFLMMGFMSVAALPCFMTFVGEFGILLGAMRALPWPFLAIIFGLLVAATYCVRAINGLLMGPPKPSSIKDLTLLESVAAGVLIVPLILFAFAPSILTGPLNFFLPTIMHFSL